MTSPSEFWAYQSVAHDTSVQTLMSPAPGLKDTCHFLVRSEVLCNAMCLLPEEILQRGFPNNLGFSTEVGISRRLSGRTRVGAAY